MKKVFTAILFLCLVQTTFSQAPPLTQAEYVKMLYALQKDPGGKTDIVEALRKRGIDFVLTDGLRGLTRSKSANDDELKRVIEEADRRRQNPAGAKLPSSKESAALIATARKKTLEAVGDIYSINGFTSEGRRNVKFYVVKDFNEKYSEEQRSQPAQGYHGARRPTSGLTEGVGVALVTFARYPLVIR